MPTQEEILLAVAGKGVERRLTPERDGDMVVLRYTRPTDERTDNLHKQSIRSLVQRIAPDWKIHILSMGESGFSVEVRPAPKTKTEPPLTEAPMIDLSDQEKLKQLSDELAELVERMFTSA